METKFKKGKWYKYLGDGYALRCSKDSNTEIIYDSYINLTTKKYTEDSNRYNNQYVTNIEIPLSEIRQYLPEGHPDLIEKKSLAGRYVKCKHSDKRYFTTNKYYKIIEGEEFIKGGVMIVDDDGDVTSLHDSFDDFELMLEGFIPEVDDFVLPEKWCCKRTQESASLLNDYFNKHTRGHAGRRGGYTDKGDGWYFHYPNVDNFKGFKFGYHLNSRVMKGYTEITFEQFKKYVLKEESTHSNNVTVDDVVDTSLSNEIVIPKVVQKQPKVDFIINTDDLVDIKLDIKKPERKIVKPIEVEQINIII